MGMKLRPGMVLTAEPGIYVGEHSLKIVEARMQQAAPARRKEMEDFIAAVKPAVAKYMNIGIRIEDDVLVTDEGHEVLSKGAPKGIRDIETLMKRASHLNR